MKRRKKAKPVVRGQEWWRRGWERDLWNRWALECYMHGRTRGNVAFSGSPRWPVRVSGNKMFAWRQWDRYALYLGGNNERLVGRFYGKYLVLHRKRAPRWLKNWARTQDHVYVLDSLDRGTLAAHLMKEKLMEAS